MARRRGVTQGAVSKAIRPGGALHAALLPGGGRGAIDLAHPAARAWLAEARIEDDAMTAEQLAEATGLPLGELAAAFAGELRGALLPPGFVGARTFARLAGERLARVLTDLQQQLRPAVTPSRHIDVGHAAALAYLAAHPFPRGPNGEPVLPDDFPPIPCVDGDPDKIQIDHPFARAFLARCNGRVLTDEELGLGAAP